MLELCLNGARDFLFCLVVTEEVKRFSPIFLRGWFGLVEKLCLLGVAPSIEFKGVVSPVEARCSPKGDCYQDFCRYG